MVLKYLLAGVFVKIITGFDDTLTRVPIIAKVAKTRKCKIVFSLGTLIATIIAIAISLLLAGAVKHIHYYRYVAAGMVFALAAAIHFDLLVHKPRTKAEQRLAKMKKCHLERFAFVFGVGFIASFATLIDDIVAYSAVFVEDSVIYTSAGIIAATLLEIYLAIYASEKLAKIKYKDEISSIGLIALGVLILTGII